LCKAARAGKLHQPLKACRFCVRNIAPERGYAIVSAPLVVSNRCRATPCLDDQALLQHSVDGAIQCARAQLEVTPRAFGNVLDDGVSMPLGPCEAHQDVERCQREWQVLLDG
jgi:hypothetical protein